MESKIILLLAVVGVLVFLTNLVVEVVKRILPKAFPTDIAVFVVAIALCEAALFGYNTVFVRGHLWYEFIAVILIAFMVAYIAMFGWQKLNDLWQRSKKPE